VDANKQADKNVRNCTDVYAFPNDFRGVVMANQRKELRSATGAGPARQGRIARYREQSVFFTRLAAGERDATFRDRWKNLARECASSASRLENERAARSERRARPWPGKNALKMSQGGGRRGD